MKKTKSHKSQSQIRVRREPPTLDEAIAAAQGLSDDLEQQVAIAAGLIGMTEDEVRPHALQASRPERTRTIQAAAGAHRPTVVVVQRRTPDRRIETRRIGAPR